MTTIERLELQIKRQQSLREHLLGTVAEIEHNLRDLGERHLEMLRDNDEPRPDYSNLICGVVFDTGPMSDPKVLAAGRAL